MRAEILDDAGHVINTIVAEPSFLDSHHPGRWREVVVATEQPALSLGTRITRLAFRQRLGQAALIGIELASIHNPAASAQAQQLAAMLRVMQADLISATHVDLSRADTRAGVQQLEAAGLIPPGHAAVVLDTPVSAVEVPSM